MNILLVNPWAWLSVVAGSRAALSVAAPEALKKWDDRGKISKADDVVDYTAPDKFGVSNAGHGRYCMCIHHGGKA